MRVPLMPEFPDERIRPRWVSRIKPGLQARATAMAEAWVAGQTYVQIGREHGISEARVGQIIQEGGLHEWAVAERQRRASEKETRR